MNISLIQNNGTTKINGILVTVSSGRSNKISGDRVWVGNKEIDLSSTFTYNGDEYYKPVGWSEARAVRWIDRNVSKRFRKQTVRPARRRRRGPRLTGFSKALIVLAAIYGLMQLGSYLGIV